ncbi:hypothetical protein EMCRGX_G010508 [Ephydatia muelleri]
MADEHDDIEVTSDTTIAVAPVKKKLKLDKPPDSCVKTAYHPSGPKFLNTKLWKNFKDLKECKQERSINDEKEAATSFHGGLITKHFIPPLLPPWVNDIQEYREYIEFISRGSYALPHRTKTADLHDEAASEIVEKIRASALRASSISLTTDSNAIDPKAGGSSTTDLVQLFRTITSTIRNSSQRLEFLKKMQREKMKSDKEMIELLDDDVLPADVEAKYDHTIALTVIKDIVTRWKLHLLHVGALHDTGAIYKRAYANAGPPSSWNLEVQSWNHDPSEVYECYLLLKSGFLTRFDPLSHLLTDAALVHPGHKNLSRLTVAQKAQAHARFIEELYTIAGISDNAPANVQLMAEDDTAMIALDGFFDFDKHDAERLTADPAAMRIISKEMVDDEFRRYLAAESTNWRVNNVMEWWSTNEGHFPNIAKMAL